MSSPTPSLTPRDLESVDRFAVALDVSDFAAAAPFVDADCVYHLGDEVLTGRDAIIGSYREHDARARAIFDGVAYESRLAGHEDRTVKIEYTDVLTVGDASHTHRCRQRVTLGADGRIIRIEHVDLPGEPEAVRAFKERCGIA